LEAKSENRLSENQSLASLNFPVFGDLRQSYHAPTGHHDACKWGQHCGNLQGSPFETPPPFNSVERKRFFDLSNRLESLLTTFRTPTNAICFVLALGYFKATKRFFARQCHATDADYVARQLGYLPGVFDPSDYKEATARWHRTLMLEHLGFLPFDEAAKQHLLHEIRPLIRAQVRPKVIFLHELDVLGRRKTEIPNARTLTDLIIGETRRHKSTLTEVINAHVPPELRALLEALLEKADASTVLTPQFQRFKLTLLKQISQSAKPSRIASTLDDWQTLRLLYEELAPVIASLDLTPDGIRYYTYCISRRNFCGGKQLLAR
jgi:hypothetical protein